MFGNIEVLTESDKGQRCRWSMSEVKIAVTLEEADVGFLPSVGKAATLARDLQKASKTHSLTEALSNAISQTGSSQSPSVDPPVRELFDLRRRFLGTHFIDMDDVIRSFESIQASINQGESLGGPMLALIRMQKQAAEGENLSSDPFYSMISHYVDPNNPNPEQLVAEIVYLRLMKKFRILGIVDQEKRWRMLLSITQPMVDDEKSPLFSFNALSAMLLRINLQRELVETARECDLGDRDKALSDEVDRRGQEALSFDWAVTDEEHVTTTVTVPYVVRHSGRGEDEQEENYQEVLCNDTLGDKEGPFFSWRLHFKDASDLVTMVLDSTHFEGSSRKEASEKQLFIRAQFLSVIVQKLVEQNRSDQAVEIFHEIREREHDDPILMAAILYDRMKKGGIAESTWVMRAFLSRDRDAKINAKILTEIMRLDQENHEAADKKFFAQELFLAIVRVDRDSKTEFRKGFDTWWGTAILAEMGSDGKRLLRGFVDRDRAYFAREKQAAHEGHLASEILIRECHDRDKGYLVSKMVDAWGGMRARLPFSDYSRCTNRVKAAGWSSLHEGSPVKSMIYPFRVPSSGKPHPPTGWKALGYVLGGAAIIFGLCVLNVFSFFTAMPFTIPAYAGAGAMIVAGLGAIFSLHQAAKLEVRKEVEMSRKRAEAVEEIDIIELIKDRAKKGEKFLMAILLSDRDASEVMNDILSRLGKPECGSRCKGFDSFQAQRDEIKRIAKMPEELMKEENQWLIPFVDIRALVCNRQELASSLLRLKLDAASPPGEGDSVILSLLKIVAGQDNGRQKLRMEQTRLERLIQQKERSAMAEQNDAMHAPLQASMFDHSERNTWKDYWPAATTPETTATVLSGV